MNQVSIPAQSLNRQIPSTPAAYRSWHKVELRTKKILSLGTEKESPKSELLRKLLQSTVIWLAELPFTAAPNDPALLWEISDASMVAILSVKTTPPNVSTVLNWNTLLITVAEAADDLT